MSANLVKEFTTITISVGVAMRKVNIILIIRKVDLEGQSVIKPSSLFFHAVLVIAYILPFSLPS